MLCTHCAYSRKLEQVERRLCMFTGEKITIFHAAGDCAGQVLGWWDEAKKKPTVTAVGEREKVKMYELSMQDAAPLVKEKV